MKNGEIEDAFGEYNSNEISLNKPFFTNTRNETDSCLAYK